MLGKSFRGWKIKQEIQNSTAIRTPSPRLNPVRESPGSPTRPTPLTSLSPLPALFSYCQNNLPPTSHFRFSRQTNRFPLCTGPVATGFSSAAYCCRAPEPNPNSPDDFTHVEYPNAIVESLRESSVGVDDGREDDGEGLGRRRTLPEELSSTVVVLTCMSKEGSCYVFLLGQGLCREEVPVIRWCHLKGLYLRFLRLDVDMFKSLMWNSKAVVSKREVRRGHEIDVALEEAIKYGDKVANKLAGYPGDDYKAIEDDFREMFQGPPQEMTKFLVSFFYGVDDGDNKTVESFDQEMSKESPTLMKTIVHERD